MKAVGYALITAGIGVLVYLGVEGESILAFAGAASAAVGEIIDIVKAILDARDKEA